MGFEAKAARRLVQQLQSASRGLARQLRGAPAAVARQRHGGDVVLSGGGEALRLSGTAYAKLRKLHELNGTLVVARSWEMTFMV